MASRGIAPEVARKLLVRAFIADAFAAMPGGEEVARLTCSNRR
jgi:Fe-S cluster assembly scaffold protein SufB